MSDLTDDIVAVLARRLARRLSNDNEETMNNDLKRRLKIHLERAVRQYEMELAAMARHGVGETGTHDVRRALVDAKALLLLL